MTLLVRARALKKTSWQTFFTDSCSTRSTCCLLDIMFIDPPFKSESS